MRRILECLLILAVLMAAAWVAFAWAMRDDDGQPIGPNLRHEARKGIVKLFGEAKTKIGTAERRASDFRRHTTEIQKASLRVNYHLGRLGEAEADATRQVGMIESELQYMKGQIEAGEPIRVAGGELSPTEIGDRIEIRRVELDASRECLGIIANERARFEKLYEQQLRQLRTAPIHQKTLDTKLGVLRMKYSFYQDSLDTLDRSQLGPSEYKALYDEAKRAIDDASAELDGATPQRATLQPLLIESSDTSLAESEEAVKQNVARIEAILNGGL